MVRDVSKLRDFVERLENSEGSTSQIDEFELLKESPMMGDGKFKLEIGAQFQKR